VREPSEADALRTILVDCLGVSAGEDVLVVTDPGRRDIAEALVERARDLGCEAVLAEMAERSGNAVEPPEPVRAAMLGCDVMVAPTSVSLSHTEARRTACERGVRAASMPGATRAMLVRTMSADYDAVRRRSRAVAAALSAGREVRVTSARGTDLTLSIEGREGIPDDGDLSAPGAFGNLPAGEGFVAPVEGSASGAIVFDGDPETYGGPVEVTVRDGYARSFGGPGGARLRAGLERHGPDALAVCELGIGTNEAARPSGNVLEDEKVLGTVHVAFGDNHSFGGTIRVASHSDLVILEPTVTIDARPLLEGGRLLL
jgi:leucyl aminopeptidase (aminopeptidase T)